MASVDVSYHALLHEILEKGYTYEDPNRKGVNRLEILSHTFRHEFKNGFPAITTKKLNYNNVVTELLWFLRGDTNIKYLVDNGCNIWNKDAYNYYLKFAKEYESDHILDFENFIDTIKVNTEEDVKSHPIGLLGPIYGKQWRSFGGVDQIKDLIQGLKDKPLGTEHIVMAWNPGDRHLMALPPCHYGFQIVVKPLTLLEKSSLGNFKLGQTISDWTCNEQTLPKYGFELHWNQRSVDTFLGLPFNIASYATLSLILEKITGYKALAIQGNLNKVHLYDNSLDAVKEQLDRDVLEFDKCELSFKDEFHYITDKELVGNVSIEKIIEELQINWFKLQNYDSYPAINVKMLERNE